MSRDAEHLKKITSFKGLLAFLEEKMHWPIGRFEFDDVTFEYDAKKLGLKDAEVAKIKSIHQLRPLKNHQPWNIFFIEFETKKIPVAVLRRILGRLVADKKKTKNHEAIWNTEDLLFISSTGATDKEIAFAHFHQHEKDKPTLRVLGWDGGDTLLKLDDLAKTMKDKLRWPDNENDIESWRHTWSSAFKHKPGEIIRTADDLAEALAGLAKRIHSAALVILQNESEGGPLRELHKMVQGALVHDLKEEDFADTFAQTITYGLLTAAIANEEKQKEGKFKNELVAEHVAELVPVTNPLLKELLSMFLEVGGRKAEMDFDELGVQDVVELLRSKDVDLPAIIRDFGKKTRSEDPIIHFYEHFLGAYNKALKNLRGVFYTPQPVVSYIVRSVDELLKTEFGIEDGLASAITWGEMAKKNKELKIPEGTDPDSHFVVILDPATGTGTFLIETIDLIFNTLKTKWNKEGKNDREINLLWNVYVPAHLLPRLFGYELMMAPYAIAHMRLGLKLHETGYRFEKPGRAQIYLTNALEPTPTETQMTLEGMGDALAREAQQVNNIKQTRRFTVVLGNPPYSVSSQNKSAYIEELLNIYKEPVRGAVNIQPLSDDYIKFLRIYQKLITTSGGGLVGVVTNNVFIDGLMHRGVRSSMLSDYTQINILNLHGNSTIGEKAPDGSKDENVFDIKQGVSVSLFIRQFSRSECVVRSADIFGSQTSKYAYLNSCDYRTIDTVLNPHTPNFFFAPKDFSHSAEYDSWLSLSVIMPIHSTGVATHRDGFLIDTDPKTLRTRIEAFIQESTKTVADSLGLKNTRDWNIIDAKKKVKSFIPATLRKYAYKPFSRSFIYYEPHLIDRGCSRVGLMRSMFPENIALVMRKKVTDPEWRHAFVTRDVTDFNFYSYISVIFPLRIDTGEGTLYSGKIFTTINLDSRVTQWLNSRQFLNVRPEDATVPLRQEEAFLAYVYAIIYSNNYRKRYVEFLKIDFPHVPLCDNSDLYETLVYLGTELIALHLLESTKLTKPITEFVGGKGSEVEKVTWSKNTVWLDKAQTTGLKGIPEAVWNFHIGDYQVCEKWLKDRKGRKLSKDDITHYQKIVVALSETIRLMKEIDELIEKHGGWPDAFQTKEEKKTAE